MTLKVGSKGGSKRKSLRRKVGKEGKRGTRGDWIGGKKNKITPCGKHKGRRVVTGSEKLRNLLR